MAKTTRSSTAAKAQKGKASVKTKDVKAGKPKAVVSKKPPTSSVAKVAGKVAKASSKVAPPKAVAKKSGKLAAVKKVGPKPPGGRTAGKKVAEKSSRPAVVKTGTKKAVMTKAAVKKVAAKKVAVKKPAGESAASKPVKSQQTAVKTTGDAVGRGVKPAAKAGSAKPESNNGSASPTARLFKGKVASATAMVTPKAASASKPHDSPHKNQKSLSSSMNKLAVKKLDNGVTREDGRYALPATSTITLPKGYHPSSKEEYMSPQHLAYFRNKLRDWRDQLVEESRQTMDNLRDEVRDVGDEAERATRETENSLELRTRDRYRKLISKIDKALRRIEEGSYGFCEETDEEIGIDRLDARPIATLSLDAQERREHLQKQMGD